MPRPSRAVWTGGKAGALHECRFALVDFQGLIAPGEFKLLEHIVVGDGSAVRRGVREGLPVAWGAEHGLVVLLEADGPVFEGDVVRPCRERLAVDLNDVEQLDVLRL